MREGKLILQQFMVEMIPGATNTTLPPTGQVYVVLSTADGSANNKVSDENTISGVGVLEVLPPAGSGNNY
jgi:hypothetical protein